MPCRTGTDAGPHALCLPALRQAQAYAAIAVPGMWTTSLPCWCWCWWLQEAYQARLMFGEALLSAVNMGQILHAVEDADDAEKLKTKVGCCPIQPAARTVAQMWSPCVCVL